MATNGEVAIGDVIEAETFAGSGVYFRIGEVTNLPPPNQTADSQQFTHMESPGGVHEFRPGLIDPGDQNLEVNYIPGGTAHADLMTDLADDDAHKYKITFPGGTETVIFTAFVTDVSPATPIADVMTCSASFKPTGKPTWS